MYISNEIGDAIKSATQNQIPINSLDLNDIYIKSKLKLKSILVYKK